MTEPGMNRWTVHLLLFITLALFITMTIGLELHIHIFHSIDLITFKWWLSHFGEPQMNFRSGIVTGYFTFFAKYFDIATVVALTIFTAALFAWRKYYAFSVWLLTVVATGGLIGIVFKGMFHRARPYDHLLLDTGYSFPSGHSLSSSLFFIIILFVMLPHLKEKYQVYKPVIYIVSTISWLSILISRLYFHAHFLTDVIGGVAFGIFWVMLFVWLYQWLFDPVISKLMHSNKSFQMVQS
ncbi:phosphatase PAP2 family protein [Macrococcus lamae]|nr:phosphatase PAP2 family protein [Macrococcus lamae]